MKLFDWSEVPNSGQFMFMGCFGKEMLVWEEPIIGSGEIEKCKLVFEGADTKVSIKQRDARWLYRTPLLCTSNSEIRHKRVRIKTECFIMCLTGNLIMQIGKAASASAAVARSIATGLVTIHQLEAAHAVSAIANTLMATVTTLDYASEVYPEIWLSTSAVSQFLQSTGNSVGTFLSNAHDVFQDVSKLAAGGTADKPAAAAVRMGTAPTPQDLQSTAAPELSTTQDPTPSTDPAIPQELESANVNFQNDFLFDDDDILHQIAQCLVDHGQLAPIEE